MKKSRWPTRFRRTLVIIGLNGALAAYSVAVASYVRGTSSSVVTNMWLILGWVALVGAVSYIEASVIRKLVVRGGWRGRHDFRDAELEHPRPWRDLHLPLTIAILALAGLNMLVFDQLASGFFIKGQRANYAITRMRSDDEVMQRGGILTASRITDPRVRRALAELLEEPGPGRPLAAWALGKTGTPNEAKALVQVLHSGEARDRAAAAVALGRLGDKRLAPELAPRLRGPDEPLESYLYGLGLLGDRQATSPIVELLLDDGTAPDHLALATWALGRLDDPRACPVLVEALAPTANPLTCAATHSIESLRCADAGPRLIAAFEGSRPEERCDAMRFADLDGSFYELWPAGLYRVEVLSAVIRSRDHNTRDWLRQISTDRTQVPQIRHLARRAITRRRTANDRQTRSLGREPRPRRSAGMEGP